MRPKRTASARAAAAAPRVAIEQVSPAIDDGRHPVRRILGDTVEVSADILCDGHERVAADLLWRPLDSEMFSRVPMTPVGNDRWTASFVPGRIGPWRFAVEAWRDRFASWRDEVTKKRDAGLDVHLELIEGRRLVAGEPVPAARDLVDAAEEGGAEQVLTVMLGDEMAALMRASPNRPGAARSADLPVEVDRRAATFAAWYEIFPRSMSDDENRHGTFDDVIRHLPRVAAMGFDVLYFPPIHPIGRTARKGRNNSLRAEPGEPGSPYAIGSPEGGHDAIHPQLGTPEDFRRLVVAAGEHGLEIALDFAIQCAPDHPWLKAHKGWFDWRPDGSLKTAENPPKRYEDIVNVDFYKPDAVPDLWLALFDVVMLWCRLGVRTFRVDNPHTKPFPFWQWLIASVRARHPETLFLAEAFTRPKVMNRLAKIGFSQSYTYFTWRNTRAELEQYMTELTTSEQREFFRPHFFVNTPDINPVFLQTSGRPGFLIRASLAATLSSLWGVYCGFELCEGTPVPGREEYLDSEKYQLRAWDFSRPGNIVPEITALNRVRQAEPALWSHLGVRFLPTDNPAVIAYERFNADRSNVLFVAINLDPSVGQTATVEWPLWRFGLPDQGRLAGWDLLADAPCTWHGKWERLTLDPARPVTIRRAMPV